MYITSAEKRFQSVNRLTILSLFLVIIAGGVVRSTGSGMGCPDWPKCFGQYIPPTHVSQLPANYKEKFVEERVAKNIRFAKTLDILGYADLADRIRHDKSILEPEEFNSSKTWTEYANRLVGAITGIVMIFTAIYSFSYRKIKPAILLWSVFNLFLVGFQGWLGSIVVSTNLVAWIVTVHMLLALAILAIAIYTYHLSKTMQAPAIEIKHKVFIRLTAIVVLLSTIAQIVLGTEVRESIDEISTRLQGEFREDWVAKVGTLYYEHREWAILVVIIQVVLYALVRKNYARNSVQQQIVSFAFLMMLLQVVTGLALSNWALPPFAQAAHIVLASLMFGAQFYLILNLKNNVKTFEG